MKFTPGQTVKFNTSCIWNGCSGTVARVDESVKRCSVELPDGETRMAFGFHELEIKG